MAVLACLAGMACKETMVTAPLAVLLYDWMFLAGSPREIVRRRWGLYLALALTWGLMAYLVLSTNLFGRDILEPGKPVGLRPYPAHRNPSLPAVVFWPTRCASTTTGRCAMPAGRLCQRRW